MFFVSFLFCDSSRVKKFKLSSLITVLVCVKPVLLGMMLLVRFSLPSLVVLNIQVSWYVSKIHNIFATIEGTRGSRKQEKICKSHVTLVSSFILILLQKGKIIYEYVNSYHNYISSYTNKEY